MEYLARSCCKCIGKLKHKQGCELNNIYGVSDSIFNLLKKTMFMVNSPAPVLITGESGTGKELFARALHYSKCSLKKDSPFVAKNSAGIDSTMSLNELFGHEAGAFTGALKNGKKGLFELANNGTLFLDEIGDITEELQVALLRVLEEHQLYRLGGSKKYKLNLRIIAATNKNLPKLIEEGKFREDLYYRLNVFSIHIPPLRERREDIIPIALHLLDKLALQNKIPKYRLTINAMKSLMNYSWPGNVRELENMLTRTVFSLPFGDNVVDNINLNVRNVSYNKINEKNYEMVSDIKNENYNSIKPLKEVEREIIIQTLIKLKGNRNQTAKSLGISRNTLYKKIAQYDIRY